MTSTLTGQLAELHAADPIPVALHIPGHPVPQGDVMLLPLPKPPAGPAGWVEIPAAGLVVVPGGHDHTVVGDGRWLPAADGPASSELTIGWLDLAGPGHLLHVGRNGRLTDEHGAVGLAAGVWEVRGQRETAREGGWRRVVD